MLWLMLSVPGSDVSPRARAALMSWRASSVLVQPRSSRCRRSQAASSDDIEPYGNGREFRRDTPCPAMSRIVQCGDHETFAGAMAETAGPAAKVRDVNTN